MYASFLAVVALFVVASFAQIVQAVFGVGAAPLARAAPPAAGSRAAAGACGQGVARLSTALDRGFSAATVRDSEAAALRAFDEGVRPEWNEDAAAGVEKDCRDDARGRDAFAALLRLKLAEEEFLRRQVVELAPLRRDVEAYLPR